MLCFPYHIEKPSRYIGVEPLSFKKDLDRVKVRFGLLYPDIYEVGMSYYGLFLLYEILNSLDFVLCERAFAPWHDMETYMRKTHMPLFTLETKTPLYKMDILGFSLTYELNLTNVLNMLDLSFIPRKWQERTHAPLVIAGGPLTINPAPFESFFDVIVCGEAEEVLPTIVSIFKEVKHERKETILRELLKIEGVYLPPLGTKNVKRIYVKDLDKAYHSIRPPVPVTGSIHNRLTVEISRGCGNGCRFCLAGFIYRPYRERSLANIKEIVEGGLKNTGYEELSFLSLSTGQFSYLPELLKYVSTEYNGISVSLPSLKVGSMKESEIESLGRISRTGLTFAIESASNEIRKRINKHVDLEGLLSLIPILNRYGWRRIKIYLMIGFPWEKEEDFFNIRDLVKAFERGGIELVFSVSPFVPKPHTPFQWLGMEKKDCLVERFSMLKSLLKGSRSKIKMNLVERSIVECIIGRGDRLISYILEYVHGKGGKLEAWREFFNPSLYFEAFEMNDIELERYVGRLPLEAKLPWDFVDTGIDKEFLKKEMERAERCEDTIECYKGCAQCGIGCELKTLKTKKVEKMETWVREKRATSTERLAIRYKKAGKARFIGHLDTVSILIRALRRSGLQLQMHGRYHPLPKVSFSKALPLFVESSMEWMEFVKESGILDEGVLKNINEFLPEGLKIIEVKKERPKEEDYLFLVISKYKRLGHKIFEKNNRYFHLVEEKDLRKFLEDGQFERIIKVRKVKVERWLNLGS